jgi:hypothetical protein
MNRQRPLSVAGTIGWAVVLIVSAFIVLAII